MSRVNSGIEVVSWLLEVFGAYATFISMAAVTTLLFLVYSIWFRLRR